MNNDSIISDLEIVYERNFEKIYRYFYYKYFSANIAEDLTSETFLRFVRGVRSKEVQNYNSYLYGIAKLVHLENLRKKYKNQEIPLEDEEFEENSQLSISSTGSDFASIAKDRLIDLLKQIPPMQSEIIRLRIFEQLTPTEIVMKLNKNLNYVRTTQKRAVRSLKKLLSCTP